MNTDSTSSVHSIGHSSARSVASDERFLVRLRKQQSALASVEPSALSGVPIVPTAEVDGRLTRRQFLRAAATGAATIVAAAVLSTSAVQASPSEHEMRAQAHALVEEVREHYNAGRLSDDALRRIHLTFIEEYERCSRGSVYDGPMPTIEQSRKAFNVG